jgi:hypothetical protein
MIMPFSPSVLAMRKKVVAPPSNVFTTDFGAYAADEAPDDWTILAAGAGSHTIAVGGTIGKVLELRNGSAVSMWDAVPAAEDSEIFAVVKFTSSTVSARTGVAARIGDVSNNYHGGMYYSGTSDRGRRIGARVDGSLVALDSDGSGAWSADTYYAMRLQIIGTALKFKSWIFGESEPEGWHCEVADGTFATGGLGVIRTNTSGSFVATCQWFSVGINGQPAAPPP